MAYFLLNRFELVNFLHQPSRASSIDKLLFYSFHCHVLILIKIDIGSETKDKNRGKKKYNLILPGFMRFSRVVFF